MEIKKPSRKQLKGAFVLFLVAYVSVSFILLLWSVGSDLGKVLLNVRLYGIGGALAASLVFLTLDAFRFSILSRGLGKQVDFRYSMEIILSGFILAVTTPFGSGGLPYQVWLLKRKGYSIPLAVALIMLRGVVLFIPYILMLPFVYNHMSTGILKWVFYYAVGIAVVVMLALILRGDIRDAMTRIRFVDFLLAILISFPAQIAYLSILFFVFASVGISAGYLETLSTQLVLQLTTYFSPSPGGIGIAEAISAFVLSSGMEKSSVGMVILLWRFFSAYLFAIMGFFVVMRRLSRL